MAITPEGKIKQKVSAYLKSIDGLWYFMPVPGGYGVSTIDYLGCYHGAFFGIETKAPGKKPTDRQEYIMEAIRNAGGKVFVIDDVHFLHFKEWIGLQQRTVVVPRTDTRGD